MWFKYFMKTILKYEQLQRFGSHLVLTCLVVVQSDRRHPEVLAILEVLVVCKRTPGHKCMKSLISQFCYNRFLKQGSFSMMFVHGAAEPKPNFVKKVFVSSIYVTFTCCCILVRGQVQLLLLLLGGLVLWLRLIQILSVLLGSWWLLCVLKKQRTASVCHYDTFSPCICLQSFTAYVLVPVTNHDGSHISSPSLCTKTFQKWMLPSCTADNAAPNVEVVVFLSSVHVYMDSGCCIMRPK